MNRKTCIRISALVAALALCLSLPRLFPVFAHASSPDEPRDIAEDDIIMSDSAGEDIDPIPAPQQPGPNNDDTTPGDQLPEGDNGTTPGPQEPGEGGGDPTPDPQPPEENGGPTPDTQQPGADGDGPSSGPDGAGDATASDDFDEGGSPPAETDEEDEDAEGPGEAEPEPEEEEPEEPLPPATSDLTKSSRSVSGYNVFDVDSFDALTAALSATSYPSEEHPENSVYILLTGDVEIEREFTLHQSIDKLVIDGDGRHTLSERNLFRTHVSPNTTEVHFKNLTIAGRQYFGLFDNTHSTDVHYLYERVNYTGPQILWAPNSTAYFTDCVIRIVTAATEAHEVAEVRDVFIHGDNQFHHNSTYAVFYLYNNGSLVLSQNAALRVSVTGANPYILYTANPQSTLRLEDRAALRIEGSSSQLAGSAGLHSIFLGNDAAFHWAAHRSSFDYIAINSSGGAKDALYLSEGAEFRVAPNGAASERLIRIDAGNVVVGPGADLSLRSVLYSDSFAPFHLAAGSSLTVGEAATFTMEIGNRNTLSAGLIYFGGAQSGFFVDKDATVVLRGNKTSGAVYFSGNNSAVEITNPNYLEIGVTTGFPICFVNATAYSPSTLTYTDVQQVNYWRMGSNTYLNGGRTIQRWVAETEGFTVKATYTGSWNRNVRMELNDGLLDQQWTSEFNSANFSMSEAQILSVGKVGMEASSDGSSYQGRLTAPTMGTPYDQGAVQLRVGPPQSDRAASRREPATPEFHVAPYQTVAAQDQIAVWAEYGYVFHNNPPSLSAGTMSLTAPAEIHFGTLPVSFSDMEASAQGSYALHVRDQRGAGSGWQVLASFSGFSNADKPLDSTLVLNDIALGQTPQCIAAATGSSTVPLNAGLRVPGCAADTGTYSGNITWTLVDAP